MLTPSLVLAYWMRGSMAEILYASGLSLSRRHSGHQQALAAVAAIVGLGGAGVIGGAGAYYANTKIRTMPLSKSTTASDAAQTAHPLMRGPVCRPTRVVFPTELRSLQSYLLRTVPQAM